MIADTSSSPQVSRFGNLSLFPGIRHFVSTRVGGCSRPPFDSLNIGFRTADDPANVRENRRRLLLSAGIPPEHQVAAKQVHGCNVAIVTEGMRGRGAFDYESALEATDALVTNAPEVCVMVQVADCTPVLLYDPVRQAVAAVHAGWRSTVRLIVRKTVRTMADEFGSRAEDLIAGIGPSIGPCCYQIGPEVIEAVHRAMRSAEGLLSNFDNGRAHLDLWEANRRQLLETGVRAENIETAGICTRCRSDLFFSERFRPGTGRCGAGVMLLDEQCASCTATVCAWCRK